MRRYIEAKTFEEFCCNQNKLIEILNHRTDKLERHIISIKTDVSWTKKLLWSIFGVTVLALIVNLIKTGFGI
jgi:hypothetical protein